MAHLMQFIVHFLLISLSSGASLLHRGGESGGKVLAPTHSLAVSLARNSSDTFALSARNDPCKLSWQGQCSCDGAIEFMGCVNSACGHSKCECQGSKKFDSACHDMAKLCPNMGLVCGGAKATCGAKSVALAEAQDQYQGPDWGILDSEGGNLKAAEWVEEPSSWLSYLFAAVFVLLIGSMPIILNYADDFRVRLMTITAIVESVCLYIWLIGGLYLFTNVLYFQSPHFGGTVRSLNLIEAVYLFSQIITTVGYGDITPAKPRGQVFIGVFVVISIFLIAGMMSQLADIMTTSLKTKLGLKVESARLGKFEQHSHRHDDHHETPREEATSIAMKQVWQTLGVFACFVLIGTLFFSQFPGEGKTVSQGVYMSMITLSSVGFGAFTPVTKPGMVFGAFWMLFGVSSLGALVSSFTAYISAMKAYERAHEEREREDANKGTLEKVWGM